MDIYKEFSKKNVFSTPFHSIGCESNDMASPKLKSVIHKTVVPTRKITCAATGDSVTYGSPLYYALCGLGGILSCGSTHVLILPLDLVKCRIQVDPVKYPNLMKGLVTSVKEEGLFGLYKGWVPTALGYGAQGCCKFGFYEVFKKMYGEIVGPENYYKYTSFVYLAASASAEFIADIPLSPFESMKVRIQTVPGFPSTMRGAYPAIMSKEGIGGFYKSLIPLWGRQIPYTMAKFASFEKFVELIYKYIFPKPRDQATKPEQLLVTFSAGYIAGVFCGIVSHPADTMVSKLQEKGTTIGSIYNKIGMVGLWKGLGPRILMIGTLTALQWFIYDAVKVSFHLPRIPPPQKPSS